MFAAAVFAVGPYAAADIAVLLVAAGGGVLLVADGVHVLLVGVGVGVDVLLVGVGVLGVPGVPAAAAGGATVFAAAVFAVDPFAAVAAHLHGADIVACPNRPAVGAAVFAAAVFAVDPHGAAADIADLDVAVLGLAGVAVGSVAAHADVADGDVDIGVVDIVDDGGKCVAAVAVSMLAVLLAKRGPPCLCLCLLVVVSCSSRWRCVQQNIGQCLPYLLDECVCRVGAYHTAGVQGYSTRLVLVIAAVSSCWGEMMVMVS